MTCLAAWKSTTSKCNCKLVTMNYDCENPSIGCADAIFIDHVCTTVASSSGIYIDDESTTNLTFQYGRALLDDLVKWHHFAHGL